MVDLTLVQFKLTSHGSTFAKTAEHLRFIYIFQVSYKGIKLVRNSIF